jgi:hypothetical protein
MPPANHPSREIHLDESHRRVVDGAALTALGLVFFFGYLTLRAFNATHVWYPPHISPTVALPLSHL